MTEYKGFKEVSIRLPNGAQFTLSESEYIRSADIDLFAHWLNFGRRRMGMPEVLPGYLGIKGDITLKRFNELAQQGILPTDEIEMAYGNTLTVVPRGR